MSCPSLTTIIGWERPSKLPFGCRSRQSQSGSRMCDRQGWRPCRRRGDRGLWRPSRREPRRLRHPRTLLAYGAPVALCGSRECLRRHALIAVRDPKIRLSMAPASRNCELPASPWTSACVPMRPRRGTPLFSSGYLRPGRPVLAAKWAQTLDGQLIYQDGTSQWITGPEAQAHGHWLRQRYDAILVGADTVLADRPTLTVRDCKSPVIILFGSSSDLRRDRSDRRAARGGRSL